MTPEEIDKKPFSRAEIRILECIPAIITWTILLMPAILSFSAPIAVAYFMIFFDLWWLFRSINFSIALMVSFFGLKKKMNLDWLGKLHRTQKHWDDILHVVAYPFYNEDYEILENSVASMARSEYPKDKVVLLIAAEERGGPETIKNANRLKERFADDFADVLVAIHPDGIAGEVKGKAPNINFAMKKFEEELLPKYNVSPDRIIIHSIDSDSVLHPQHFAHTAHTFINTEKPNHHIFQFIPLYHNNLWDVPAMMRIIATGNTFWLLIETTRRHRLRNFAVYAMTLTSLRKANYWDKTSIIEDGVQYWRHLFAYSGDFSVVPIFSPVYMDAVLGDGRWKTLIAQYKQLRRWSWGASDLALIVPAFIRSPEIPLRQRIVEVYRLLNNHISWSTLPLLLILIGWTPMLNESFKQTSLGYNLPGIASLLLSLALGGVIVAIIVSMLMQPHPHKKQNIFQKFLVMMQWLLLPFITIFLSFPAIHSQTALAFGQRMEFIVTVKKRGAKDKKS